MTERLITLKQLNNLTGINIDCLRTYLQGYRFTKFEEYRKVKNRSRLVYKFNQQFVDEFTKFIWERRRVDVKHALQKKLLSLAKQEYKKRKLY